MCASTSCDLVLLSHFFSFGLESFNIEFCYYVFLIKPFCSFVIFIFGAILCFSDHAASLALLGVPFLLGEKMEELLCLVCTQPLIHTVEPWLSKPHGKHIISLHKGGFRIGVVVS